MERAPAWPELQLLHDASSGARDISEKPRVGAVNLGRAGSAARAGGARRGALRIKDAFSPSPRPDSTAMSATARMQQLLQPEHDPFHREGCQPS